MSQCHLVVTRDCCIRFLWISNFVWHDDTIYIPKLAPGISFFSSPSACHVHVFGSKVIKDDNEQKKTGVNVNSDNHTHTHISTHPAEGVFSSDVHCEVLECGVLRGHIYPDVTVSAPLMRRGIITAGKQLPWTHCDRCKPLMDALKTWSIIQ